MIEEHGLVIESRGNTVLVKTERSSSCESCMSKETCFSADDKYMVVEAENSLGAKVGDRVVFEVGAGTMLKAGMLFYLVPLLTFIAGVVLGQVIAPNLSDGWNADLVSAGLGFFFLVITSLGLRAYGKASDRNKTYRPKVVKIAD